MASTKLSAIVEGDASGDSCTGYEGLGHDRFLVTASVIRFIYFVCYHARGNRLLLHIVCYNLTINQLTSSGNNWHSTRLTSLCFNWHDIRLTGLSGN